MKFHMDTSSNPVYTERIVKKLIPEYGHEYIENASDVTPDTILLVSVEDIMGIYRIEKTRKAYPNHRILTGGHLAKVGTKAMALFSDAVWVGHIFEMLECKSWDDVMNSIHTYYHEKEGWTIRADKIEWDKTPLMQVGPELYYLWHGVGCKFKCSFCMTSWTEKHQTSSLTPAKMNKLEKKLGKKGSVKIISNEYELELHTGQVQDIILRDYLYSPVRKTGQKKVRCGVEFATEQDRRRHGKPIDDSEIAASIRRAKHDNYILHLFFICGYNTREEWAHLIEHAIPEDDAFSPRVFFKFTNMDYNQKTPLWRNIKQINFDCYATPDFTDWFHEQAAYKNKRFRTIGGGSPCLAIWRMLAMNVQTMEEHAYVKKLRNQRDFQLMQEEFWKFRPWKNDMSRILTAVNEVRRAERGGIYEGKFPLSEAKDPFRVRDKPRAKDMKAEEEAAQKAESVV